MRILLTGFTGVQANAGNSQLQLISNLSSISQGLIDLGHTVDWRPVVPGERLDDYDKIIVSINGTGSWVSPFALGALWAASHGDRVVFTVDDWQCDKAFKSSLDKELAVLWNPKLGRKHHEETIVRPDVVEAINYVVSQLVGENDFKCLVPALTSGDVSRLCLNFDTIIYDPSPYQRIYTYESPEGRPKTRQWVCAGLQDESRWVNKQGFSWPVEYFGVRKLGQMRLKEHQLANVFADSWGVVMPPHRHAGSGWWRVRILMAAEAGCILFAGVGDRSILGTSYSISREQIENRTETQLTELAALQKEELELKLWSKERLQELLSIHIGQ